MLRNKHGEANFAVLPEAGKDEIKLFLGGEFVRFSFHFHFIFIFFIEEANFF
jgi:hypothetical protein